MSPLSHFFLGWVTANAGNLTRRERAAVTLAGVVPDLDGLGLAADIATGNSAHPLEWYPRYHHVLGHNLPAAVLVTVACVLFAGRRLRLVLLALASFHLHLLADLAGSRGPDGSQWESVYLWPFSQAWQWRVSWQWQLNAWPNIAITALAIALTLYLAWRRGFSPLEMISLRWDQALVATLRRRFPRAPGRAAEPPDGGEGRRGGRGSLSPG